MGAVRVWGGAVVICHEGRLELKADALFVGVGVVYADDRIRRGEVLGAPPGEESIGGLGDGVVQLDQREVGAGEGGPQDGASVEIVEQAVAIAAAGGRIGLAAGAVEEVPVGHQRGCLSCTDAAVVGGHEVGRAVLPCVVDQKARAEGSAARADDGHRLDNVTVGVHDAPTIGGTADDVEVARAGSHFHETDEVVVDVLEFELQRRLAVGRHLHLHHQLVAGQDGRPKLLVFLVVGGGERAHHRLVIGRVQDERATVGHPVLCEAEVEGLGPCRADAHPPEGISVGQLHPLAMGGRADAHLYRLGEAGGDAGATALQLGSEQCLVVQVGHECHGHIGQRGLGSGYSWVGLGKKGEAEKPGK